MSFIGTPISAYVIYHTTAKSLSLYSKKNIYIPGTIIAFIDLKEEKPDTAPDYFYLRILTFQNLNDVAFFFITFDETHFLL